MKLWEKTSNGIESAIQKQCCFKMATSGDMLKYKGGDLQQNL